MGTEKTKPWKIQVGERTIERLQKLSDDLGRSLSANEVAATAVFEISRIPARNLWTVLGVIRQYADPEMLGTDEAGKRLASRSQPALSR